MRENRPLKGFSFKLMRHMCGRKRFESVPNTTLSQPIQNVSHPFGVFPATHPLTRGKDSEAKRFIVVRAGVNIYIFFQAKEKSSTWYLKSKESCSYDYQTKRFFENHIIVDMNTYHKVQMTLKLFDAIIRE